MTKTILCYGDSLTWGYNATDQGRHAYEDRWPSVLQEGLGDKARVIAEGLNGRTTVFDDNFADCDRNGARVLPTVLSSHAPLDLVILMLGTNDMKSFTCGSAFASAQGIARLVSLIRSHAGPVKRDPPDVLVVAPPRCCETANSFFSVMFAGAVEESAKLPTLLRDLSDELGCGFFDGNSVARTTVLDGVHLDADNSRALGRGLEPIVRVMLGI